MNKLRHIRGKSPHPNVHQTGGLLTKLSKSYSNVSHKLIRKSPGRQGSPCPVSSGSYNMTGTEGEDHRLEIGAPILIAKTALDVETIDTQCAKSTTLSSDSDNDVFADAADSIQNFSDIKFSFFPTATEQAKTESLSSTEGDYEIPPSPKSVSTVSTLKNSQKSKSVSNLHKSELKVFLTRTPSLELRKKSENISTQSETSYDFPKKLQNDKNNLSQSDKLNDKSPCDDDADNSSVKQTINKSSYLAARASKESVNSGTRTPIIFNSAETAKLSNSSLSNRISTGSGDSVHNSSAASTSDEEDFDLKSASFQSLDAKNLFLSIEELNEITRQINESEDFNQTIDLEYCEHRDNLRPNERRITLLRNKNHRRINLNGKKEKLTNAWSGLKNWIGEEGGKLKDAVQRHAAMQRVGANNNGNFRKNQPFFDEMRNKNKTQLDEGANIASSVSQLNLTQSEAAATRTRDTESLASGMHHSDHSCSSSSRNISADDSSSIKKQTSSEERELPGFIQPFLKKHKNEKEGQNGFEELRRFVKQGGDFGKDLMAILQERADSEQIYAKSLSKMASKLSKACREIPGSVADAWRGVATEMESRSEVHRQFSNSLTEEIVKPLKIILDNQHKARKTVESTVDKSARILSEWRTSEAKSKKSSHSAARENEKLQDAMLDVRISRSPSISLLHHGNGHHRTPEKETKNTEKDSTKLDNKRRKAEEAVKKADVEYYTLCVRAERARVDWEMSVLRGSSVLQSLENQRLSHMKDYVGSYLKLTTDMSPLLERIAERLSPQINACNVQKDIIVVKNIRRASEGPSEQLLPDFYCEHTTLAMNRERRKQALVKLLQLVRQDLERERRSRNGLKGLSQTLSGTDNQNITDKLYHIRSMLTYLEGARYKLQSALMELDHKPRGSHPLAPHIQITRDRTGLQQSILKVPLWLKNNEDEAITPDTALKDLECFEAATPKAENCVDIKNETLIKQFTRPFSRSKSNLEYGNDKVIVTTQNGKSATLSENNNGSPIWDRGIADGGSNQHDSDFDEFSSQDEDEEIAKKENVKQQTVAAPASPTKIIGRCKAIYSYTPKLYDELELNPGDMIEVHGKQEDGWWVGALKDKVGIFPATYVEEIS